MTLATRGSITDSKLKLYKKKYKNFYFITITCNKHPEKLTVSDDTYFQQLSRCGVLLAYCWELNSCGQLHIHGIVASNKVIYMKELNQRLKKIVPEFTYHIKEVPLDELVYVNYYLGKLKFDVRAIYYRLARFYEGKTYREDFSELADLDFEYNSKAKRFKYIDSSKTRFID